MLCFTVSYQENKDRLAYFRNYSKYFELIANFVEDQLFKKMVEVKWLFVIGLIGT